MEIIRFGVGPLDNNTYLVVDEPTGSAALIDPSFGSRGVWDDIRRNGWTVVVVINTHAHIDHVVENAWFVEQSGAPLALHPADRPLLDAMDAQAAWLGVETPTVVEPTLWLSDSQRLAVGHSSLAVVHTPGHSPGSITLLADGVAIVGDVLFAGSVGRTDLPGGDKSVLLDSIRTHVLPLPDDTRVCPGHGAETTIGLERRCNPFLQDITREV